MKSKYYIKTFETFIEKAINILIDNPCYTRSVVKYTHQKKTVILKVTDDKQWALFKLNQDDQTELLEKFIKIMSQLFSNKEFQNAQMEQEETDDQQNIKKNKKQKKRA